MKIEKVGNILITEEAISIQYFVYKDCDRPEQPCIEALKWAQKRINDELKDLYKEDKENIKNSIQRRKSEI